MNINDVLKPARMGWVCPKCQTVHSPDVKSCAPCSTINKLPAMPPKIGTPIPNLPPLGWPKGPYELDCRYTGAQAYGLPQNVTYTLKDGRLEQK